MAAPMMSYTEVYEDGHGQRDEDLLAALEAHLTRYVAFPSEHELVAVVLWVVHAHSVESFDSSPRLALLSPEPGSGKTRVLEVLDTLVPNPMHVLSASPAAIFRTIAQRRPTLLLDEVDAIFGRRGKDENNEDLRALLNAGHRSGATIPRCVGPTHDVKDFPVYAAVALAGLGDLPDTLMSRSVVVRMRRRKPGETVHPFRMRHDTAPGHALRDRLVAFVAHVAPLLTREPVMPAGIDDRPADVWEPLLAVADAAGGTWPTRARAACLHLAAAAVTREASLGVRLLCDLRDIFGDEDHKPTATILTELVAIEEAPWVEIKGKPIDARFLARLLGQYGIESTNVRVDDTTVLKGYRAEDLFDAWQRYLPPPPSGVPDSATAATSATSPSVAPVAQVAHSHTPGRPCCEVCGTECAPGARVHPNCEAET